MFGLVYMYIVHIAGEQIVLQKPCICARVLEIVHIGGVVSI